VAEKWFTDASTAATQANDLLREASGPNMSKELGHIRKDFAEAHGLYFEFFSTHGEDEETDGSA
jgi:hypothetical protein